MIKIRLSKMQKPLGIATLCCGTVRNDCFEGTLTDTRGRVSQSVDKPPNRQNEVKHNLGMSIKKND